MNTPSSAFPLKSISRGTIALLATSALLVLPASTLAAESASASPSFPLAPHRPIEVSGSPSINDTVADLARGLELTEAQRAQLKALMIERAKAFATQTGAVRQAFREKTERLLTAPQRENLDWSKAQRWSLAQWTSAVKGLSPVQTTELGTLIDQRDADGKAVLGRVQKAYSGGLQLLLGERQRARLTELEAAQPRIHIPNK